MISIDLRDLYSFEYVHGDVVQTFAGNHGKK